MSKIGTVQVEVTPVMNERAMVDLTERIRSIVRECVRDAIEVELTFAREGRDHA